MNGSSVIGRRSGTIFIRLPLEQQRVIDGGCTCDVCKARKERDAEYQAKWDTLAVAADLPAGSNDYAWTVHMPEAMPNWVK